MAGRVTTLDLAELRQRDLVVHRLEHDLDRLADLDLDVRGVGEVARQHDALFELDQNGDVRQASFERGMNRLVRDRVAVDGAFAAELRPFMLELRALGAERARGKAQGAAVAALLYAQ